MILYCCTPLYALMFILRLLLFVVVFCPFVPYLEPPAKSKPAEPPVVLVERDPDFLVASKQGLFPFVSTSVLTVRHPLCSQAPAGGDHVGLREWREVWEQVLVKQVPYAKGDVWVVR